MLITFLGTGSAIPIPRHTRRGHVHSCPQCRSRAKRDRRWPSAVLVAGSILIDAGPQIVELLGGVGQSAQQIRTVFLTHRHDDAAGGLENLPSQVEVIHPKRGGAIRRRGADRRMHRFRAVKVPHDRRTWGYLIDDRLAYFSDYSDITRALAALRRAKVAVLDGSGWKTAFPSHQPMADVIPIVKTLRNLKRIFFTHNGHLHEPHRELDRRVKESGDRRFAIAYHGLRIRV